MLDRPTSIENEYNSKIRKCRISICLIILYTCFFIIFIIPEVIWKDIRPDLFFSKFYPQVVMSLLEDNIIKKTQFPMSAYAFWSIIPFFMIVTMVLGIFMLWPSREFKRFLMHRNTEKKNLLWAGLCVILICIGILLIDDPSSILNSFFKPFQRKTSFFFIYGTDIGFALPLAITIVLMDFRARLYFTRRK